MASDQSSTAEAVSPSPTPAGTAPAPAPASRPQNIADQYDIGDAGGSPPVAADAPVTVPAAQPPGETPAPPSGGGVTPFQGAGGRFLPRGLVQMGQDFGIPEQDLREMDADRLADTLRHMQRLALSDRSAERTVLGQLERTGVRQDPARPPAPETTTPAPVPEFMPTEEDGWSPKLTALAKTVQQILADNQALKTQLGSVSGHLQQQQQTQLQNEADAWFAKRPEYGKGGRSALGRGSPDLLRRMALLNVAKGFTGSLSEQMEQAHQVLYPAAPAAAPVPAQATGSAAGAPQAGEWAAAGAARPTQRSGAAEPNGVAKAVQSVERLMTEQRQQGQAVTLDDFPG